jgi:hypothetical protein
MQRIVLLAILLTLPVVYAWADDFFNGYFLPSDKKMTTALFVQCEAPVSGRTMACSFTDIDVRHKVPAKQSESERAELVRDMLKSPDNLKKMCDTIPPPEPDLPATGVAARKAILGICADPSAQAVGAFIDAVDRSTAATCKIATMGTYRTKFTLTNENATSQTWTANNGPEGYCAVVVVESLEKDKSRRLEWTYRKQNVVGAPAATEACKMLKTTPQEYQWRDESRSANCDYIQFSPTFVP